ncbi:hypothetical protein L7F22_015172 [Adiantum nelumboides]|nr:hypothetical protein [Adiantum nelumboides]
MREIYLSYQFVKYDITATVLQAMLVMLATHVKGATSASSTMTAPLWQSMPGTFLWAWLFAYVVTLANQAHGAEEDAVNKPTRPIPSGDVTVKGAYYRLVWVCCLFVLFGACQQQAAMAGLLSVVWVASSLTLNLWRPALAHLHWLMKPIVMMIGTFVLTMVPASMANPAAMHHRPTLFYMAAVSLASGALALCIQDLRDVEGDKRWSATSDDESLRRLTLPILLGDMPARYLCSFLMLMAWVILHGALMVLAHRYNLATSICFLALSILLCFRTLFMRSPSQDHHTYLLLVYLVGFCQFAYLWVV